MSSPLKSLGAKLASAPKSRSTGNAARRSTPNSPFSLMPVNHSSTDFDASDDVEMDLEVAEMEAHEEALNYVLNRYEHADLVEDALMAMDLDDAIVVLDAAHWDPLELHQFQAYLELRAKFPFTSEHEDHAWAEDALLACDAMRTCDFLRANQNSEQIVPLLLHMYAIVRCATAVKDTGLRLDLYVLDEFKVTAVKASEFHQSVKPGGYGKKLGDDKKRVLESLDRETCVARWARKAIIKMNIETINKMTPSDLNLVADPALLVRVNDEKVSLCTYIEQLEEALNVDPFERIGLKLLRELDTSHFRYIQSGIAGRIARGLESASETGEDTSDSTFQWSASSSSRLHGELPDSLEPLPQSMSRTSHRTGDKAAATGPPRNNSERNKKTVRFDPEGLPKYRGSPGSGIRPVPPRPFLHPERNRPDNRPKLGSVHGGRPSVSRALSSPTRTLTSEKRRLTPEHNRGKEQQRRRARKMQMRKQGRTSQQRQHENIEGDRMDLDVTNESPDGGVQRDGAAPTTTDARVGSSHFLPRTEPSLHGNTWRPMSLKNSIIRAQATDEFSFLDSLDDRWPLSTTATTTTPTINTPSRPTSANITLPRTPDSLFSSPSQITQSRPATPRFSRSRDSHISDRVGTLRDQMAPSSGAWFDMTPYKKQSRGVNAPRHTGSSAPFSSPFSFAPATTTTTATTAADRASVLKQDGKGKGRDRGMKSLEFEKKGKGA